LSVPLRVGEKLQIIRNHRRRKDECLVSQILEHGEEDIFDIAMPMKEGRLIPLHVNSLIKVLFFRENGQFSFDAKIIQRIKEKIPVLKIQKISKIHKIQRRSYYRLNAVIPLKVHYSNSEKDEEKEILQTYTLDISGGGLKFAAEKIFNKNEVIICELNLNNKIYNLKSRVIRTSYVYHDDYTYKISTEFIDLEESVIREVVQFIFNKQMKMRRKGLI